MSKFAGVHQSDPGSFCSRYSGQSCWKCPCDSHGGLRGRPPWIFHCLLPGYLPNSKQPVRNASTLYTLVTFVCSFPISYLRIFFLNIVCWQRGRLRQNFWKTGLDAGKSHQQRSGCDDRKTQLPETHQGGQSHVYNHFLSHRERVSAVTGWMSWQIAAEVFKS